MTEEILKSDADVVLTKLMRLFGPPPLHRNESIDTFKEIFAGFFDALGPEDLLSDVLVYHIAIETSRIFRLLRYKTLLEEKRLQDQRIADAIQKKQKALEDGRHSLQMKLSDPEHENEYSVASGQLHQQLSADYQREIGAAPSDLDYASLVETLNETKIELRIGRAIKRRDDALKQISWYRIALANKLRKISDNILERAEKRIEVKPDEVPLIPHSALYGKSK